jgi:hypothetical protein
MNILHPLTFVSPEKRKPLFLAFLALTLILFAIFRVLDVPLRTSAAPNGIVSFELARTPENAYAILNSWLYRMDTNPNDDVVGNDLTPFVFAAFGLGIDYLFMPTYALALSLGILLAAGHHPGVFAKLGAWLGWGALVAPLFDGVENFALFQLLANGVASPWPEISYWCATFKFILLIVGLIYALIGWLWPRVS